MAKRGGRRGKKKARKKGEGTEGAPTYTWIEEDGIHSLIPGEEPSEEELEAMTREYQKRLRKSPLWDELVKAYGREGAEQIIQQCRMELRKG
jgi:hypothetical protein